VEVDNGGKIMKVVDGGVMGELEVGTVVGGRWRVVLWLDSGGSSLVYLVVEIGGLGFAHMLAHRSDRLTAMSPAKLLRLFRFAQSLRCMWRGGDGEKDVRQGRAAGMREMRRN